MIHTLKTYFKKGLYGLLVLVMGNLFLFGNIGGTPTQITSAQGRESVQATQQQKTDEKLLEFREKAEVITRLAYFILWPVLVIAGWAMDNSMVYGEIFGFDSVLRTVRNLTKNIANFALWFIFLFILFKNLFGSWNASKELKNLITNTLIAGILIQASRFVTAVAVDISTIATYGIGGLPMTILGNTQNTEKSSIKDTKILGTEIYVDLKDKEHTITTIKTTQNGIKISPCATMTYQPDKEDKKAEKIIIGRELLGYQPNNKWIETKENVCHYMEGIYRFQKELDELPKDGKGTEGQEIYDLKLDEYITNNYQDANKQDAFKTKITNGEFLQIYRNPLDEQFSLAGTGKSNYPIFNNSWNKLPVGIGIGYDMNLTKISSGNTLTSLSTILEDSKSYLGVFSTLYSSLLSENQIWLTKTDNEKGIYETLLNSLLNFIYTIALVVPLLALAIVLVARVGILRVVIAIAPIIVLLKVFNSSLKSEKRLGETFSLENIGKLLIAPAFIALAISFSTIFISIIKTLNSTKTVAASESIFWLIEINIKGGGINFAKLLISFMGVALVWFLLFWAIRMNSVGRSIGEALQKTTEKAIGNLPIIPIGEGKTTGISQVANIGGFMGEKIESITQQLGSTNNEAMGELFGNFGYKDVNANRVAREQPVLDNLNSVQIQSIAEKADRSNPNQVQTISYESGGKNYNMTATNNQILSRIGVLEWFVNNRSNIKQPEQDKTKPVLSNKIKEMLEKTENITTENQLKSLISRYKSQNDIKTLKDVERTVDKGKKFKLKDWELDRINKEEREKEKKKSEETTEG